MRYVLVVAASLAACGPPPPPPTYVTAAGVSVYNDGQPGYPKAQADFAEDYLVKGLGGDRDATLKCLRLVQVHLWDLAKLEATDPKTRPAGLEEGDYLDVGFMQPCLLTSAWIHEEAHWLQSCLRGVYDPAHKLEPWVWQVVNTRPGCEVFQ